MANIDTYCTVLAREASPVTFEKKAPFQVEKYRSRAQPRRLRASDDAGKGRQADRARVTIRDLDPEEKRKIASLIQVMLSLWYSIDCLGCIHL
jgi:hypothetical protein